MAASLSSRAPRAPRVAPYIEHLAWSVPVWLDVSPPRGQVGGQLGHQLAVIRDEPATIAGRVDGPVAIQTTIVIIVFHCRHLGGWRGAVYETAVTQCDYKITAALAGVYVRQGRGFSWSSHPAGWCCAQPIGPAR
jgi:hypothetical protein